MATVKSSPILVEIEYSTVIVPAALAVFSACLLIAAAFASEEFGEAFGLTVGAGLCALAAVVFREKSRLRIDLSEQMLSYTWAGFWKRSTAVALPLPELLGIRTERNNSGRGGSSYRACLVTSSQVIPLTQASSSTWRNDGRDLHGLLTNRGLTLTHEEKDFDISTLREIHV